MKYCSPSLFSENAILQNNKLIDELTEDCDESYLSMTLNHLMESSNSYTEATKTLYTAIVESEGNDTVVHEAFENFFGIIKSIVETFLKFIKSLIDRFLTQINSFIKSDKYLNNHFDELYKFDNKNIFTFEGYRFTADDPNVPSFSTAETEFIQGYDINFSEINSEDSSESRDKKIIDMLKDRYEELRSYLSSDYYDKFRKEMLGVEYLVSESEFRKELFSIFRDNSADKIELEVDNRYIRDAIKRFKNYSDLKETVSRTKTNIEEEYKRISKAIEAMSKSSNGSLIVGSLEPGMSNYGSVSMSATSEAIKYVDLYKRAKVQQLQKMSQIHGIAFAAKLDALKECFNQDKSVLYKALYITQGTLPSEDKDKGGKK